MENLSNKKKKCSVIQYIHSKRVKNVRFFFAIQKKFEIAPIQH